MVCGERFSIVDSRPTCLINIVLFEETKSQSEMTISIVPLLSCCTDTCTAITSPSPHKSKNIPYDYPVGSSLLQLICSKSYE